jgi:hypothetical protein
LHMIASTTITEANRCSHLPRVHAGNAAATYLHHLNDCCDRHHEPAVQLRFNTGFMGCVLPCHSDGCANKMAGAFHVCHTSDAYMSTYVSACTCASKRWQYRIFTACILLLWFVGGHACASYTLTWLGILPLMLISSLMVFNSLFVTQALQPHELDVRHQQAAQTFAWTAAEMRKAQRARAALYGVPLAEAGAVEPLFCVEVCWHLHCLYACWQYVKCDSQRHLAAGLMPCSRVVSECNGPGTFFCCCAYGCDVVLRCGPQGPWHPDCVWLRMVSPLLPVITGLVHLLWHSCHTLVQLHHSLISPCNSFWHAASCAKTLC